MRYEKIQPRDIELLTHLYFHRFLTGELIAHLPLTCGDFPSQQVANNRIRRLVEEKLAKAFTVHGIKGRVLRITENALPWIADWLDVGMDDLSWNKHQKDPKGYFFLRHLLLNNKFRIAVERATRDSDKELIDYIPEHIGKRHVSGRITENLSDSVADPVFAGLRVNHTPDAVFALRKNGKEALFFVEVDRGTERQYRNPDRPFYKMVRFYLGYMQTGRYKAFEELMGGAFTGFRVLLVSNSQKRIENMKAAMTITPSELQQKQRFIWLSVFDESTSIKEYASSFFEQTWRSLALGDNNEYRLL